LGVDEARKRTFVESVKILRRCPNCGTFFPGDDRAASSQESSLAYRCPVCEFVFSEDGPAPSTSASELEAEINQLVASARQNGVQPDDIVQVLRDELAFMCELAQPGRRVSVEVIDLGPQDDAWLRPREVVGRDALLGRGLRPSIG
jgi:rubredoxin